MSVTMSASLAARGLRPVAELALTREHGDRLRYMAGCRCFQCRRANSSYEAARKVARAAGDWNGIVDAAAARAHMARLSKANVGRRAVGDVAGIADSVLTEINAGRKTRIRARTERAILAVTVAAAADHALIDAKPTWRLLDELLADGYTKVQVALTLGNKTPALQIKRGQVTVRTAHEVQKLHARLRCCDARATLALLEELSEEGFHRDRVAKLLAASAAKKGLEMPDLTVRRGRIRHSAAQLVALLHAELTA